MPFNKRYTNQADPGSITEEDYNAMVMRQRVADSNDFKAGQQRQTGMVGSGTRQMGDSLEKSTKNFVDGFGKGQAGATGIQNLQQGKRDGLRDDAQFDKDFRNADSPQYHQTEMAPAARHHLEKSGYQYRQPSSDSFVEEDIGDGYGLNTPQGAPPPQPPRQDMSSFEDRGEHFRNMEERPNYQEMSLGQDGSQNMTPAQPPNQSQMQPSGFPPTGPDTGYSIPDQNYSPGAADVLDGRASPGMNRGTSVEGPYRAPVPQFPSLTEEDMQEDQLKKKESIPVTEGRWGQGLGNQDFSPDEQDAANQSWAEEETRLARKFAQAGPIDRMTAPTGGGTRANGLGFNLLQAASYNKDLQARENLRGTELDNLTKMYGPPLSEKDQLDREDKESDRDFKEEDRAFQREKWAFERERLEAESLGLKDTGKVSAEGHIIYADKRGQEMQGTTKVKPDRNTDKRSKVGVTDDNYNLYDGPDGEVKGGNKVKESSSPDQKWEIVPNTPGGETIKERNPYTGAIRDTGLGKEQKPKKDPLTPSVRKGLNDTVAQNKKAAQLADMEINEWLETEAMVKEYNSGIGPGSGVVGAARKYLGGIDSKSQGINQRLSRHSFENIVNTMKGMSRAIDSNAERARYEASQPHLGLDNKVLERDVRRKINALVNQKAMYEAAVTEAQSQIIDSAADAEAKGGEAPLPETPRQKLERLRKNQGGSK